MIELHERLSEFSYGYGVTREVELLLAGVGVNTVPFLPSLVHEKKIGFDVGFGGHGIPILLQFKLGQSPQRFVRSDTTVPAPSLAKPFWRFSIDTGEPDGQFETLLKAEGDGAEVYYVAPRFTDWPQYASCFEKGEVLANSLMITPSEIRAKLDAVGATDGHHRIAYDGSVVHVCSKPAKAREARPAEVAERIKTRIEGESEPLGERLLRIFKGLDDRSPIRRRPGLADPKGDALVEAESDIIMAALDERTSPRLARLERSLRLERIRSRAYSEADAVAAALGAELWSLGIQLLFATQP